MVRLGLGSLLAAVAMYVLGAVWWLALPFANMVIDTVEDDAATLEVLSGQFDATGVYFVPFPNDAADDPGREMERVDALQRSGPIAMVLFRREGVDAGATMGLGFLHLLVVSVLLAAFLHRFARGLPSYGSRVAMVALLALTAVTLCELGNPVWYHQPWDYWVVNASFDFLLMLSGGLVLAWFIRPPHGSAPASSRPGGDSARR